MSGRPAIVLLAARAGGLAGRISLALGDAEIHAPVTAACAADQRYERATEHMARLFRDGRPVLGICAAGILVRALAPVLADKRGEPPVLAIAEDGSVVVPLLGGHRGANELARQVAAAIGAMPAITTASDLTLGFAPDAPPTGWRLARGCDPKPVMARLLEGEPVRLTLQGGGAPWLEAASIARSDDAMLGLVVTHRVQPPDPLQLVYHPAVLAVGVGCERDADGGELADLVTRTLDEAGLAREAVAGLFSVELKMAEPGLHAAAARLGLPVRFFRREELGQEAPRLASPSPVVEAAIGIPGVAEAAALRAAGPEGQLVVTKRKSRHCTCAVAQAPIPIEAGRAGRPRGRLSVVGIGPGDPGSRTFAAAECLRQAQHVVGYGLYLELVADLTGRAERHAFPLGEEALRCSHALDLAAQGSTVALVCSGDPGIYAMASLAVELAAGGQTAWQRIEVEVLPGVSAFQAAAARVGAAIGHDFCAISLSDLLTPMAVIEDRLRAAAQGDFVVALYNPVSQRRRSALVTARAILLGQRPPGTPVVLARNLGRADESVQIIELQQLDPDAVDMLTVVLVGARGSRLVHRLDGRHQVLTPRGYRLA